MTESNFEYDLDIIDNAVLVEYEGLNNGRGIFSYNFDQPLDSVRYAEINHIDTSDPKSNLGRWIAEETGQIQTNR